MRWAILPENGFCSLKFTDICIICNLPCTLYILNYSWFWLNQIQEYSLPYFLCHGSPPLSFGHADPPRSSKYWPCLDAAIPFQGFLTHHTCSFHMYILHIHFTCTSYYLIKWKNVTIFYDWQYYVGEYLAWKQLFSVNWCLCLLPKFGNNDVFFDVDFNYLNNLWLN